MTLTCIESMLSYVIVGQMVCPALETALKMFCAYDMQTLHVLEPADLDLASVAFGPEGTVLYSSPLLPKLIEFDYEQDRVLRSINMQSHALGVSMCGKVMAFADASGLVGLLRYQGAELILLQGMTSCLQPDQYFAVSTSICKTRKWRLQLKCCCFESCCESCCNLITAIDVCRPTTSG